MTEQEKARRKIEADTAAFLAAGGKVKRVSSFDNKEHDQSACAVAENGRLKYSSPRPKGKSTHA